MWKLVAVGAVAAASAVGVAAAGLQPTRTAWVDTMWSGALGAVVAAAGSRARRWVLVAVAGVAAVVAAGAAVWFGLAAAVVGLVAAVRGRRARVSGAVVAALAVQGLVRIGEWSWAPVGTSAVVGGVCVAAVVVSGWRHSGRRVRTVSVRVAGGLVLLMAVASLGFVVSAVASFADVRAGVATAQSGIEAARTDERLAAERFRAASAELDGALGWLANPLVWPARMVPVVGVQQRAVVVATTTARDLAGSAAEGAALIERDGLRPVDGRIDTDAVAGLVAPLSEAVDSLQVASEDLAALSSPWLVGPVADRLGDLSESVAQALPPTALALQGAEVVPVMAGGDGPRQWLMLISTPAEARYLGGFVGNWALLEADGGSIDVVDDGPVRDVNRQLAVDQRAVDATDEYLARYAVYNPNVFFQNVTASPDFVSVAKVAASFWEQSVGTPVSGVISVDPFALGALVDLGGPVEIPTLGRTFTGVELSQFLVTDLYEFDDDTQDDIFSEAIDAAVDNLTAGSLPGPGALADALADEVDEGRLLMWSPDAGEQAFIAAVGLDGALPANVGQDFAMVAVANAAPNKIDAYLERSFGYDVEFDAVTGRTTAVFTAQLTNTATLDLPEVVTGNDAGLPQGTARTVVSLFTPLLVEQLSRDGVPISVGSQSESGWRTWSTQVLIPPGGSVELRWQLRGVLAPGAYRLQWRPQPLVLPPTFDAEVRVLDAQGDVTTGGRTGDAARRFELVVEP